MHPSILQASSRAVLCVLQGIQHLGSAMACFMRMKGINFHDIDTAPATQSLNTVTASQDGRNASVLPAVIQSEAVSISPVVLCPAAASVKTDVTNSNKRQKTEDIIGKAVRHSRQSTSGVNVRLLCPYLCCLLLKLSNAQHYTVCCTFLRFGCTYSPLTLVCCCLKWLPLMDFTHMWLSACLAHAAAACLSSMASLDTQAVTSCYCNTVSDAQPTDPMAACYICRLTSVPGRFLPQKAKELGVPPGPLFGKLKAGIAVQGKDRLVQPDEVPPNHVFLPFSILILT